MSSLANRSAYCPRPILSSHCCRSVICAASGTLPPLQKSAPAATFSVELSSNHTAGSQEIKSGRRLLPRSPSRARFLRRTSLPPRACVLEDDIACFLGDHVDCTQNEKSRNLRKHRGVNDAQALCSPDPEAAVENRPCVIVGANLACTAGVVTPCMVFDELSDLRTRLNLPPGYLFEEHTGAPLRDLSHEFHAGND